MSNNSGASWTTLSTPARRIDPSTLEPGRPYSRITDASVAFARDGSFYLLSVQHNDANSAGEVVLARYSPSGSLANETTVYAWNRSATNQGGAKAVQLPILAVDNTAPSFPTSSGTQTNSHVGNVYVAWIGQTPAPRGATNWNELTVELTTSTNSGATFGNALVLNNGGNSGDQRNTTPRIAVSQGGGGSQPGQVTVVWDDFNTGATADPPFSIVRARQVFNGGTTLGVQSNVATPVRVLGNATGGGTIAGPTPQGIGPSPSIAADNTLSAFYPYQGRIYVTYVDRVENDDNPADNTDIYLRYSDNGGASWSGAGRVNDDNGRSDGFSEADGFNAGRPQFQPEVTVDSGTGTLLISFYDTRNDASRGRAAQYLAASIDGGATFAPRRSSIGPSRYSTSPPVRPASSARFRTTSPAATRTPTGRSATAPDRDWWPSTAMSTSPGRATRTAGPTARPTSTSASPVRPTPPARGSSPAPRAWSPRPTPPARPRPSEFDVTFDRPVDPSSFTGDDVTVIGKDANGNTFATFTGANITVTRLDGNAQAATQFRVSFPPQTTPGTYSYAVGPEHQRPDLHGLDRRHQLRSAHHL